jgi:hypothetical protein
MLNVRKNFVTLCVIGITVAASGIGPIKSYFQTGSFFAEQQEWEPSKPAEKHIGK